mmetsp:Transcript_15044/g.21873  ORF Transcript_15044/g.21873 Transcript_15044/m.21873 type:complete len:702 (+) Transcript_15044:11-2116(+)
MEPTILAACSLNQWVLDFTGNQERIIESIVQAKRVHKAKVRLGSQLEIPGLSIEDHNSEPDTIYHSWRVLLEILRVTQIPPYNDILCLVGMPLYFRGIVYNCGVFVYSGRVILIKPKLMMADDKLNREKRWFTSWNGGKELVEYTLPPYISEVTGQVTTTFGNGILKTEDGYLIGVETWDELDSPIPSSTKLYLMGAHLVLNMGNNSFQMDSMNDRNHHLKHAALKCGGVYMYSNQIGCDGHRSYFDAGSCVIVNGNMISQTQPFSLKQVDIASAAVDLGDIDSKRNTVPSRNMQARDLVGEVYPLVHVQGFRLLVSDVESSEIPHEVRPLSKPEQIAYATASYLWDYLRRSGATGFFLPISGGSDSTSVAMIVQIMCRHVLQTYHGLSGFNHEVMRTDLTRIFGKVPENYCEMMQEVLHTFFLETKYSFPESKQRAKRVAEALHSSHYEGNIDEILEAYLHAMKDATGLEEPKFVSQGGTETEDTALQNLQGRIRMVMSYMAGQLIPWMSGKRGFLVVLGSTNLEESLTGYITKYDNSSADFNPIGAISKLDLKNFLKWSSQKYDIRCFEEVLSAEPTAELRPLEDHQVDEKDLGMSYSEINMFARLRKTEHCGPLSMFERCVNEWSDKNPSEIAEKVKRFFTLYARNRHKATVITPALHLSWFGSDDNRYDLRPFLYNTEFSMEFRALDKRLETINNPL